jgi:hypothetical protein
MGAEWLNIDDSPETLDHIHGDEDRWAYLRSPEFVEAFVRPVAAICNRLDDPILDVGCGDGILGDHIDLAPYFGFDGSQAAILRGLTRKGRRPAALWVARFEEPPPSHSWFNAWTVVLSGILEVLVKPECRVPMLETYRERFKVRHFVVCDLERLDTSAIEARYGPPVEEMHRVATGPAGVPEVKRRRKILVYRT